jgi:hypothetical protein
MIRTENIKDINQKRCHYLAMTKKKLENTFTAMRNYGMEDRAS